MAQKSIKLLIIALLMVGVNQCFAQSLQTEVEVFQEAFGLEKKILVANFMKIDEGSKGFWDLYNKYEAERKEIGQQRIKLIADYAARYSGITDKEITELFKRRQKLNQKKEKLQATYFKQMSKAIGPVKAAQFWQFETYIDAMILAEIYSGIPFIGEQLKVN